MARLIVAVALILISFAGSGHSGPVTGNNGDNSTKTKPQLLIISFDGFRYDYYDQFKSDLSNLSRIANQGVHAKNGIKSQFTTKTFATHWSIATGLYEESHGIMGNFFYDPVSKSTFTKKSTEKRFYLGEPLWVTAKRQNKTAGVFFWIGAQVDYKDLNPVLGHPFYTTNIPLTKRIDQALDWLLIDKYDLVMMYWHEPDGAGHNYGPGTPQVREQLQKIDNELGRLLTKLSESDSSNNINIVIMADHGMAKVKARQEADLLLDNYINTKSELIVQDKGCVAAIWPKDNASLPHLMERLEKIDKDQAKVYARKDIPEKWHYKNSVRTAPIIVVANEGYQIDTDGSAIYHKNGDHGYDNDLLSMRPVFDAKGPAFKRNYEFSEPFELINVYSMACHILEIEPAANNGSLSNVKHLLSNSSNRMASAKEPIIVSSIIFAAVLLTKTFTGTL